jgi:hypothetical protein
MTENEVDKLALQVADALISGVKSCADVAFELKGLSSVSSRCAELVHFMHHYVTDEDIRAHDRVYAEWQIEQLRQLVAEAAAV